MNTPLNPSSLNITENVPDEILSGVFWQLTQMPPYTAERSLSSVLRVCRRWNVVAKSTPDLWTTVTIASGGASRVEALLSRSKDVTVDVIIGQDIRCDEEISMITALMREHLHRIRNLSLVDIPPHLALRILAQLSIAAPRLELLAIINTGLSMDAERFLIPSSFLVEGASQIKHLVSDYFSIYWSSPLFHDLSTLRLDLEHPDAAPSSDLFLSVLESCPRLEQLQLYHAGPVLPRTLRDPDHHAECASPPCDT
ncbi:hypothetical protein JAAARDRAFT_63459 [Jaapia argillacea MUCL 33604]|uniref:F-box domain-containing protein n=1 Tax=Jaapia argillacea MUCL 33604 TaxID=933084 RepID=A0A067PHQ3_9AGAM|nr:hypothetical protein JAAARDRAFT_63459 [Jaapia argillacea MUCL 33604]